MKKMNRLFARLLVGFLFITCANAQDSAIDRSRVFAREGTKAYRAGEFRAALKEFTSALALRPDHPTLMYNVAAMSVRAGHPEIALRYLDTVAAMGLVYEPRADSDFVSLFGASAFESVADRFRENARPTRRTHVAFRVRPAGIVTEGIAYDPVSARFFVGSVRVPSIVQRTSQKRPERFSRSADNLWSILGMTVDARKRLLWVCTAALPQTQGLAQQDEGRTALLSYDLESGFLMRRVILSDTLQPHVLGDVVVNRKGDVYVTDSRSPVIYCMQTTDKTLQPFLESPEFSSLQGITLSPDESTLYVADYSRGLFIVDLNTRRIVLHSPLPNVTLLGIDGLSTFGSSLIAVQNGINPHRVSRLGLNATGDSVVSYEILASNEEGFAEPTLGVVVGDDYYFNAASQWESIGERGALKEDVSPKDHVVLSLPLGKQ